MSQAKDNLIAARAMIADKSNWAQCAFARDENFTEVRPGDPRAKCFCALGALYRAAKHDPFETADDGLVPGRDELEAAAQDLFNGYAIPDINDNFVRSAGEPHAAVLAIYDRAIAAAL